MTFEIIFYDVYDRYYCVHGVPPHCMRASKPMKYKFLEYARSLGLYMPVHPQIDDTQNPPQLLFDEFVFHGVIVKCDLLTDAPTLIA